MKLTKETLKRIIKEELQATLHESMPSGGTDYYNKLITLMSTKEGVYQAEQLYEFARDQLDDEEKTFLDNCFRLIEIAREARNLDLESDEISKQKEEYLKANPIQPWQIIKRQNDVFLQEVENKKAKIWEEIKKLRDLFGEQESIVRNSLAKMNKDTTQMMRASRSSREVAADEARGLFGMISI
jgi:hypothetical protein